MIFLSAGEMWAAVIGLAAAMGAAWYLIGAAFRFAARRWRAARRRTPPPGHPAWRNPRAPAAPAGPASRPPLTAMPPTASQSMAGPPPPSPQPSAQAPLTMIVHPCGCIFSFTRTGCEPCPHHAEADRDRAEINRLDQQIRQMP